MKGNIGILNIYPATSHAYITVADWQCSTSAVKILEKEVHFDEKVKCFHPKFC